MLLLAADWSPAFSWVMDLIKFGVTFGLSAYVSVRFVQRANVRFRMGADAIKDFQAAAVQYEGAAEAAYVDLYQWDDGVKTDAMKRYEGEAQAGFLIAADGLVGQFGLAREVKELHELHAKRHQVYNSILDRQLDGRRDGQLIPLKQMWKMAAAGRGEFSKYLGQARAKRGEILTATKKEVR